MNTLELRDIHIPDTVSWWPPAIGWWALLIALILMLLALFLLIKKMQQVNVRQRAITEFTQIKTSYQSSKDKIQLSQQLSQLLRQILLSSYPRKEVASVANEQWLALLNESHPKGIFKQEWLRIMSQSAYQKTADFDADVLLSQVESWVNTYPKRYLL